MLSKLEESNVRVKLSSTTNMSSRCIRPGGINRALVPHPVSSKDDIQLAAYATAVVDQVEQQLSASNRDAVAGWSLTGRVHRKFNKA